jgi:hemolysin D
MPHASRLTAQMLVEGDLINLSLCMAATAEIKIGVRRLISYLLSPLIYKQEGLREC